MSEHDACAACETVFARAVACCPYCGAPQGKEIFNVASVTAVAPSPDVALEIPQKVAEVFDASQLEAKVADFQSTRILPSSQPQTPTISVSSNPQQRRPQRHTLRNAAAVAGLLLLAYGALHWILSNQDVSQQSTTSLASTPTQTQPAAPANAATAPDNQTIEPAPPVADTTTDNNAASKDAVRPTFRCPGEGYSDEKAICDNPDLATLERRMMSAYHALAAREPDGRIPDEVRAYARAALTNRHDCGADTNCITSILLSEKSYFSSYGQ